MRYLSAFLILALVGWAASCKKDPVDPPVEETKNLTLNFKAQFDGQALPMFTDVTAPNGENFQLQVFNFFLSYIEVQKENGDWVLVDSSAYVNFNSLVDLADAEAGVDLSYSLAETGNFTAIRFGLGVAPDLNAMDPADFSSAVALGDAGNYWTAWDSYIFTRTEGKIDSLPATAGGDVNFLYHSGVDGMYQQKNFSKQFNLEQAASLNFTIDIKEVFYKVGQEIPIADNNVSHSGDPSTSEYAIVKTVITNMGQALELQ